MIFASYTYVAFLALVLALFHLAPRALRQPLLIAASYLFYCAWDWRFAFLLLALTLINWALGRFVLARGGTRWLALGVALNLAPLIVFKYSAFIVENIDDIAHLAGHSGFAIPSFILPLGISFFTFQGIAYLVDVAAGEPPFLRLADFVLYKSFWPQLIAGPIIRPGEIREQIAMPHAVDWGDVAIGCRRIVTGLAKKVVLADTIAPIIDPVFMAHVRPNAIDVACGAVGFGLQIYFDFSGYSDIAIGSARLFGFEFPENFDFPFAARSPQEFWSRWHMTLTRWLRDYLFTPIDFSLRRNRFGALIATLVTMGLCGLWHGARWTFVLWGLWHAALLIVNQTIGRRFFADASREKSRFGLRGFAAWLLTMAGVETGWLLFRCTTISQAWAYIVNMLTMSGGIKPAVLHENGILVIASIAAGLIVVQLAHRIGQSGWSERWHLPVVIETLKPLALVLLLAAVIVFDHEAIPFVYFQF